MDKKGLLKAASAAFFAQGVTAAVSAVTVLVLAGAMGAAEYGLWQLFVLTGSFSGLFHLGLCDGVYLRLGGCSYDELNFPRLGRQFRRMLAAEAAAGVAGAAAIMLYAGSIPILGTVSGDVSNATPVAFFYEYSGGSAGRLWAVGAAFLYMPLFNAAAYLGYVLQATGRTAAYSVSAIIDRIAFVLIAVAGLALGLFDFRFFIAAGLAAKTASLIWCIILNRRIVFSPPPARGEGGGPANTLSVPALPASSQTAADIRAGSRLMFANMAAQLIGGGARFAVIFRWGNEEFGRISFVMTLAGIALQFAAQFSMVIFPSLRREGREEQRRVFARMRHAAGILLPAVFLFYLPGKLMVEWLLPQYAPRLEYLAYLFPLCFFEARTQMLSQVRLKVGRMEGRLLAVNLFSGIFTVLLCFGAAYLTFDIGAVLICSAAGAAIRCLLSEIAGSGRELRGAVFSGFLSDAAVSAVFVVSAVMLSDLWAASVYLGFYALYLFIRRAEIKMLVPKSV